LRHLLVQKSSNTVLVGDLANGEVISYTTEASSLRRIEPIGEGFLHQQALASLAIESIPRAQTHELVARFQGLVYHFRISHDTTIGIPFIWNIGLSVVEGSVRII